MEIYMGTLDLKIPIWKSTGEFCLKNSLREVNHIIVIDTDL